MFISKVGAVGTANNKKDKNHHWSGYCDSSHHVAVGRLMMNEWVNGLILNGRMNGGWMDGWMDGWIDGWKDESKH